MLVGEMEIFLNFLPPKKLSPRDNSDLGFGCFWDNGLP